MSQNTVNGLVPVKNKKKGFIAASVAAVTFAVANSANAALDMTEVVTKISDQTANVETIGLAILGVLVVIAGITLLRRVVR